jgi:hypothetical protein
MYMCVRKCSLSLHVPKTRCVLVEDSLSHLHAFVSFLPATASVSSQVCGVRGWLVARLTTARGRGALGISDGSASD